MFAGFDLVAFSDLTTPQLNLMNNFCLDTAPLKTMCAAGLYFDTILKTCVQCPVGCASCNSENECTSCGVKKMVVDTLSGLCKCPSQQYYYDKDGFPRCRDCLSKCETCQNEY